MTAPPCEQGRHYFETAGRMIANGFAELGPDVMNQRMPPKTVAWLVQQQSGGDPEVCLRRAVENGMTELVARLLFGPTHPPHDVDGEGSAAVVPTAAPTPLVTPTPDLLLLCGSDNANGQEVAQVREPFAITHSGNIEAAGAWSPNALPTPSLPYSLTPFMCCVTIP
jgi:hypothetical protein